MKAYTTLACAAALLSTTYAATVTLSETECLNSDAELQTFTIEIGKLVEKDLPSVCGLKIDSASGADVNSISCQAYKDAEGKDLGSARFTFADPALIATNPVQEGSIQCDVDDGEGNSTTTTVITSGGAGATVTASVTGGGVSGNITLPTPATRSLDVSGGATLTTAALTGTAGASGSGGMASGTASGTATASSPPESTGAAAGRVGFSVGAVAGAFAIFLL